MKIVPTCVCTVPGFAMERVILDVAWNGWAPTLTKCVCIMKPVPAGMNEPIPGGYVCTRGGLWERYGKGWISRPPARQSVAGAEVTFGNVKRKKWCEPTLISPS